MPYHSLLFNKRAVHRVSWGLVGASANLSRSAPSFGGFTKLREQGPPTEAFDRTSSVPLPTILRREGPHRGGGRFRAVLSAMAELVREDHALACGFKPSLVLRMVDSSVEDLTAEQAREMEAVKGETAGGEGAVGDNGEDTGERGGAADSSAGEEGG
ncbi:protein DOG1-like 4 [Prunus yedoensis var. nudiflora]|uniref:Protein DOG1-like 4 n=1 Tax=Prunus yedoensis var. nudiflora TaxID=2094558 RepID=A0A314UXG1_PRUYE|nr:protein DOG1-like 4 [Prunus yedoensis var. nudiflora]